MARVVLIGILAIVAAVAVLLLVLFPRHMYVDLSAVSAPLLQDIPRVRSYCHGSSPAERSGLRETWKVSVWRFSSCVRKVKDLLQPSADAKTDVYDLFVLDDQLHKSGMRPNAEFVSDDSIKAIRTVRVPTVVERRRQLEPAFANPTQGNVRLRVPDLWAETDTQKTAEKTFVVVTQAELTSDNELAFDFISVDGRTEGHAIVTESGTTIVGRASGARFQVIPLSESTHVALLIGNDSPETADHPEFARGGAAMLSGIAGVSRSVYDASARHRVVRK